MSGSQNKNANKSAHVREFDASTSKETKAHSMIPRATTLKDTDKNKRIGQYRCIRSHRSRRALNHVITTVARICGNVVIWFQTIAFRPY